MDLSQQAETLRAVGPDEFAAYLRSHAWNQVKRGHSYHLLNVHDFQIAPWDYYYPPEDENPAPDHTDTDYPFAD